MPPPVHCRQGIAFARAKVGDRYVLEQLQTRGWLVGGESSGHLLCLDRHTTGDGIISSLQVLMALSVLDTDLAGVCRDWQPFPQTMINVRLTPGMDWQRASRTALAEAEAALNGSGRVVLRPSGTEPVVRVMVEAEDKAQAQYWAQQIAQAIQTGAVSAV